VPVYNSQHAGDEVDGEDVVSISKETNTCYDNRADVVPSKRRLVDFGESESSTLVGVCDVSIVVVEVVEGSIAASCLISHVEKAKQLKSRKAFYRPGSC